jgi:hypothetical protein
LWELFFLETAARGQRTRHIDRVAILRDIHDLAARVDHKSGPVRDAHFFVQYTVLPGHITHVIGQHWEIRTEFFFPMIERRDEIRADGDDDRIRVVKFANTRLVGGEFGRSTSGKRGREEREYDVLFAAEIRQLDGLVVRVGQREIRRHVSGLEVCVGYRRLLSRQGTGKHARGNNE